MVSITWRRWRPRSPATNRVQALEPVSDLLRVGKTALKTASECSFTTRKLRFLSRFRLVFL
ncbi:hypothetical protein D3880_17485 [Pseudomonas cavernae]|uniref:Uncharacterized protein n=1 Tax=Pseudomonas cavernae TaxID=2320867 RepID=A0A385Z8V0_9PSED|nr:hypothetical protein D3880_17485 [Pseudomonas cavernae]